MKFVQILAFMPSQMEENSLLSEPLINIGVFKIK